MNTVDSRIDQIVSHFDAEAAEYDEIIMRLIPRYAEMIDVLVSILPYGIEHNFSVIDLGCGTGTISKSIKEKFPFAKITCVDIAQKMLKIAAQKIGNDAAFIHSDFYKFEFPSSYDVVVSSLALHHLENDEDKKAFYKKIFLALNVGGIFINIDVVRGSDAQLQDVYMNKWVEFMKTTTSEDEITGKWLPAYYAEDRPASLTTHIELLRGCAFPHIDVVYKYYNYAVYMAKK